MITSISEGQKPKIFDFYESNPLCIQLTQESIKYKKELNESRRNLRKWVKRFRLDPRVDNKKLIETIGLSFSYQQARKQWMFENQEKMYNIYINSDDGKQELKE